MSTDQFEDMLEDTSMYANVYSFMGLPFSRAFDSKEFDAFVMGIPYDLATSGRAGTRSGPTDIRQASANLRWEENRWPWTFSLPERMTVADYGDIQYCWGDSEEMLREVEHHSAKIAGSGKTLVSLGGDHFVTLPLLRGHASAHGELALIHFDAHTDTYDDGCKYNHGCMFEKAPQEGLIDPDYSIQIGIRTDYDRASHRFHVLDAHQANEESVDTIVSTIRERVSDRKIYLTFDIDCLDPAFAPGTGTPVAGGLSSSKVLHILQAIADLPVVGFDVVEVSPAFDHSQITSLVGATLALQFLYMAASRQ